MINLIPLSGTYHIYQFRDLKEIPREIYDSEYFSITKTSEEISVVSTFNCLSDNITANKGWKAFKVAGVLDFSLTGIIHSITKPLKDFNIPVFVFSTYNTDYILVKEESFEMALNAFSSVSNIKINHENPGD